MKHNRVYILDGVNGTGKTTLSRALSRKFGGAPIVRPFHNLNPDSHWGQTMDEEERGLRIMGVPIMTPADDMYVADMLMKMQPRVAICDRSLITGLAYGDFEKEPRRSIKEWARKYWASLLNKRHKTVLVHLIADFDSCVKRCASEGRHKHRERDEWNDLNERYIDEVHATAGLMDHTIQLDTTVLTTDEALEAVLSVG
jgi:thymidylate kinase